MSGTPIAFRKQRGISLIGLILGFAFIAIIGLLAAKIIPAFTEYRNILNAAQEAKRAGGSIANMQAAFGKQQQVNDFEAVNQKDLVISKETGEYEISFAYEKRVPLVANASLLLEFEGTTAANAPAAAAGDK
jgi:type II secretory pathway pseudopilin PulG